MLGLRVGDEHGLGIHERLEHGQAGRLHGCARLDKVDHRVSQTEAAPGEAALMQRLAPDAYAARIWADLAAKVTAKSTRARAVNLDPAQVILDIFFELDAAARKARQRAA